MPALRIVTDSGSLPAKANLGSWPSNNIQKAETASLQRLPVKSVSLWQEMGVF